MSCARPLPRLAFALALALAAPSVAVAQSAQDKAAAEALFREGRALLAEGDVAAACAKLDQSVRLDRSPGALLNLADCHAREGRTASAWAEFLEAARLADDTGWKAGALEARRRAAEVEPGLSRLTVRVSEPVEGLTLSLDGTSMEQAAFGTPLPADPGEHTLVAEAPGREPWRTTVTLGAQGDRREVVVPALVVADAGGATPPRQAEASSDEGTLAAVDVDTSAPPAEEGGSVLPWVIGGIGVAALAAGAVFGVLAKGRYDDAEKDCPSHTDCGGAALDASDDADLNANLSNVGFGVGLVGIGVAAVLLLTEDGTEAAGARAPVLRAGLAPGEAAVAVGGRF